MYETRGYDVSKQRELQNRVSWRAIYGNYSDRHRADDSPHVVPVLHALKIRTENLKSRRRPIPVLCNQNPVQWSV